MINNFRKRRPLTQDNRPKYLRYDDVFMSNGDNKRSRQNSSRPQTPSPWSATRETRNASFSANRYDQRSKNNYQQQDDYYEDYNDNNNDDDIIEEHQQQSRYQSQIQDDDEYFSSRGSNIIDEKMVRYQKRQLPPLQRYGSNNPRDMYYAANNQGSYWGDENDGYRQKRSGKKTALGAIWQKFIITFTSILSLVCFSWVAYNWNSDKKDASSQDINNNGPILIEPEQPSFKVLPENPGGVEVSHKDKTVYERVDPGMSHLDNEAKLLPPQEQPAYIPDQQQDQQQEILAQSSQQQQMQNQQMPVNRQNQNQQVAQQQQDLPQQQLPTAARVAPNNIEEYSIVDDKTYYIKISAGKDKSILENESKLIKKKFASLISGKNCLVKKVSNTQGEQKHAILIGPFDSQDSAVSVAKGLGGQCYIISVKE